MNNDFERGVQFVHAKRQIDKRNQVSLEIADLKFVRLADVQDKKIVAAIQARLQLARRDLRNLDIRCRGFFTAHATEFVVVDELVDSAVISAHWAIGIFAQLQFAKFHSQGIKQEQAPGEAVAAAEDQLDRLHGLKRADDSRQHAQHAAFGTRWHQPRRRRFWIQAAVAGAVRHAEDSDLSLKAENRAV